MEIAFALIPNGKKMSSIVIGQTSIVYKLNNHIKITMNIISSFTVKQTKTLHNLGNLQHIRELSQDREVWRRRISVDLKLTENETAH